MKYITYLEQHHSDIDYLFKNLNNDNNGDNNITKNIII